MPALMRTRPPRWMLLASLGFASSLRAGVLELSLEDALRRALEANPTFRVSTLGPDKAQAQVRVEEGTFDPRLTLDSDFRDARTPTANQLSGVDSAVFNDTHRVNVGANTRLKEGTRLETFLNQERTETNSRFSFLNPNYTSSLVFNVTRPLLRNAGRAVNTARLRIALNDLERSEEEVIRLAEETLASVEKAYWDLVFATRDVEVKELSVKGAQSLVDYNKRRETIGVGSEVDTLEAESTLASRRELVLSSQRIVYEAQAQLRQLLSLGDRIQDELNPSSVVEGQVPEVTLEEAVRIALAERPSYLQGQLDVRAREIDMQRLRGDRKPQLDLVGSYAQSGLGGDLSEAHDDAFTSRFPTWSVGVKMDLPVRNDQAIGAYQRGRIELEETRLRLRAIKDQVLREVEAAVRAVEIDVKRVDAARLAEQLAQRKLDAEQLRYEQGMLSNFDLLRFQEDLANAQSRAVRAETDLLKSSAELDRAMGRMLERHAIVLEDGKRGLP